MYTYVKDTETKRERETEFTSGIEGNKLPSLWNIWTLCGGIDMGYGNCTLLDQICFSDFPPPLSLVGLSSFSFYPLNVIISRHVSSTYSLLVNVPEQNMPLMACIPYTCLVSWCNARPMAHSHCSPTNLSAFMWQLDMSDSNLSLPPLSSDLYSWISNFLPNYLTENKHRFYLCS